MNDTPTLSCSACARDLPESLFAWKKKAAGIRQSRCKECQREYARAHYRKNPEPYRERTGRRNISVKANYQAIVDERLNKGRCGCCGRTDQLRHVRRPGYLGPAIHDVIREKLGQAKFDEALRQSEVRCAFHAFAQYAGRLVPYQFGNAARGLNLTVRQAALRA